MNAIHPRPEGGGVTISKILPEPLIHGIGLGGGADGEAHFFPLAEFVQPFEKSDHGVIGRIVEHFEKVIYKNMGDIIVSGVEAGDKTTEKYIGIDVVFAGVDQTRRIGDVKCQIPVLLDDDHVAMLLIHGLLDQLHEGLRLA